MNRNDKMLSPETWAARWSAMIVEKSCSLYLSPQACVYAIDMHQMRRKLYLDENTE